MSSTGSFRSVRLHFRSSDRQGLDVHQPLPRAVASLSTVHPLLSLGLITVTFLKVHRVFQLASVHTAIDNGRLPIDLRAVRRDVGAGLDYLSTP
jgi:hypothetical protein